MFFGVFHAGVIGMCGKAVRLAALVLIAPAMAGCLGNKGPDVAEMSERQPEASSPAASVAQAGAAQPVPGQIASATQTAQPPSARMPEAAAAKVIRPLTTTIAKRQPETPRPDAPAGRAEATPSAVVAVPQMAGTPQAARRNPRPTRAAERHVLKFYAHVVKVYDKPYGTITAQMQPAQFPKERMASGGEGVPVYNDGTAFIELAVASDSTGWVKIEDVAMSAKPCKIDPRPSTGSPGPIGAGSSSVACVR